MLGLGSQQCCGPCLGFEHVSVALEQLTVGPLVAIWPLPVLSQSLLRKVLVWLNDG